MTFLVHVINGEIVKIDEDSQGNSEVVARDYPTGDVYIRQEEYGFLQWRVLVRGKRISEYVSHYPTVMPIEVHQLPECVQVVHLCTE